MENINKKIALTAAILAAITIGIGAFGAHGLKELLDEGSLASFETGVRYQMYHCLALLILGFTTIIPIKTRKWVFLFFVFGIIFFSGSIYLLSLNDIISFDTSNIGFITPIGGLLFIIGWLRLAYGLVKLK